jgi:hypothetical protein
MSASEAAWRAETNVAAAHRWPIAHGLLASVALVFGLGAFLMVRRATGALTAPLPPALLLLTAAAMLAWVWCVRVAWGRYVGREIAFSRSLDQLVVVWLPPVTLLLVIVACSYPGGRAVDWVVWLPVLAASAAGPQVLERWRRTQTEPVIPAPTTATRRCPNSPAAIPLELREPIAESGTLLQQLNRSRAADGREMISGTIVAEFAPGERMATLHVAFCPPFEALPHVEAEIADGPDASVQVTQTLHNGARLDVRLTGSAIEAATVSLEIVAHESAP